MIPSYYADIHAQLVELQRLVGAHDRRLETSWALYRTACQAAEPPSSRFTVHAAINNQLARDVMGWHVADGDEEMLWREPDGSVVVYQVNGEATKICHHPYRAGVNDALTISFTPMINYHRKHIDWFAVLTQHLIRGQVPLCSRLKLV